MRTRIISGSVVVMLSLAQTVIAAMHCRTDQQQINDNNSILMLGGNTRGPVKQIILGEFGKDVDQQKRMLGQFDRCGELTQADINYDNLEDNIRLSLVQNIERITEGWRAEYVIRLFVLRDNEPQEVHHKQGTIYYQQGDRGNITSSTDTFLLQGKKGFTETTNRFDHKGRLVSSVARSSDSNSNGEFSWHWNQKNQLISSVSPYSSTIWTYDNQARELQVQTRTNTAFSTLSSMDECQLWDANDNCTLSYLWEMEIMPGGIIQRNISAAYRITYWDHP